MLSKLVASPQLLTHIVKNWESYAKSTETKHITNIAQPSQGITSTKVLLGSTMDELCTIAVQDIVLGNHLDLVFERLYLKTPGELASAPKSFKKLFENTFSKYLEVNTLATVSTILDRFFDRPEDGLLRSVYKEKFTSYLQPLCKSSLENIISANVHNRTVFEQTIIPNTLTFLSTFSHDTKSEPSPTYKLFISILLFTQQFIYQLQRSLVNKLFDEETANAYFPVHIKPAEEVNPLDELTSLLLQGQLSAGSVSKIKKDTEKPVTADKASNAGHTYGPWRTESRSQSLDRSKTTPLTSRIDQEYISSPLGPETGTPFKDPLIALVNLLSDRPDQPFERRANAWMERTVHLVFFRDTHIWETAEYKMLLATCETCKEHIDKPQKFPFENTIRQLKELKSILEDTDIRTEDILSEIHKRGLNTQTYFALLWELQVLPLTLDLFTENIQKTDGSQVRVNRIIEPTRSDSFREERSIKDSSEFRSALLDEIEQELDLLAYHKKKTLDTSGPHPIVLNYARRQVSSLYLLLSKQSVELQDIHAKYAFLGDKIEHAEQKIELSKKLLDDMKIIQNLNPKKTSDVAKIKRLHEEYGLVFSAINPQGSEEQLEALKTHVATLLESQASLGLKNIFTKKSSDYTMDIVIIHDFLTSEEGHPQNPDFNKTKFETYYKQFKDVTPCLKENSTSEYTEVLEIVEDRLLTYGNLIPGQKKSTQIKDIKPLIRDLYTNFEIISQIDETHLENDLFEGIPGQQSVKQYLAQKVKEAMQARHRGMPPTDWTRKTPRQLLIKYRQYLTEFFYTIRPPQVPPKLRIDISSSKQTAVTHIKSRLGTTLTHQGFTPLTLENLEGLRQELSKELRQVVRDYEKSTSQCSTYPLKEIDQFPAHRTLKKQLSELNKQITSMRQLANRYNGLLPISALEHYTERLLLQLHAKPIIGVSCVAAVPKMATDEDFLVSQREPNQNREEISDFIAAFFLASAQGGGLQTGVVRKFTPLRGLAISVTDSKHAASIWMKHSTEGRKFPDPTTYHVIVSRWLKNLLGTYVPIVEGIDVQSLPEQTLENTQLANILFFLLKIGCICEGTTVLSEHEFRPTVAEASTRRQEILLKLQRRFFGKKPSSELNFHPSQIIGIFSQGPTTELYCNKLSELVYYCLDSEEMILKQLSNEPEPGTPEHSAWIEKHGKLTNKAAQIRAARQHPDKQDTKTHNTIIDILASAGVIQIQSTLPEEKSFREHFTDIFLTSATALFINPMVLFNLFDEAMSVSGDLTKEIPLEFRNTPIRFCDKEGVPENQKTVFEIEDLKTLLKYLPKTFLEQLFRYKLYIRFRGKIDQVVSQDPFFSREKRKLIEYLGDYYFNSLVGTHSINKAKLIQLFSDPLMSRIYKFRLEKYKLVSDECTLYTEGSSNASSDSDLFRQSRQTDLVRRHIAVKYNPRLSPFDDLDKGSKIVCIGQNSKKNMVRIGINTVKPRLGDKLVLWTLRRTILDPAPRDHLAQTYQRYLSENKVREARNRRPQSGRKVHPAPTDRSRILGASEVKDSSEVEVH